MKRVFISILAAAALMGCAKEGSNEGTIDNELVPIRLSAGMGIEVSSKAPINPDASPLTTFTAGVAGWEAETAPDYATAAMTWVSTAANIEASTTAKSVTLNPARYYNADASVNTYIRAWHPEGTVNQTAKNVAFENTDGSVDAMLAVTVNGSKEDKNTPLTLAFEHQTAQLNFVVKAGEGLAAGTTIESIKVKGVSLPTGFDLASYTTTSTAVDAAGLEVPGIASEEITADGVAAGNPVMIMPLPGNTVTIDVATSEAEFSNQTFTVDTENVEAGKNYTITLTFSQSGISLNATVEAWETEEGSGTIK